MSNVILTEGQIQWLTDKFDVTVNIEDGVVVAGRNDFRPLKAETVAKMVGIKTVPANWVERPDGKVSGL